VLELAAALKRENPERTAAQVQRILRAQSGREPSDRTLQRLFTRLELDRPPEDPGQQQVFGRFEATRPNELWTGGALHGPQVGGRKTYLSLQENHFQVTPHDGSGLAGLRQVSPTTMSLSSVRDSMR
jgi:hypothetical protein